MTTIQWMEYAFEQAQEAEARGEVPVGAVVVLNQRLIAAAGNGCRGNHDPCGHAEIRALRQAAKVLGNYRLDGVHLYTTLEPCCMCAGAMIHARVRRLYYAVKDPKAGAAGSCVNLFESSFVNHKVQVVADVDVQRGERLLRSFFEPKRRT